MPAAPDNTQPNLETTPKAERIAKRIAAAGICSRRDAEKLIEQGKVMLNGKRLTTPAVTVTLQDDIVVNGTPLPKSTAEQPRLFKLHKPAGVMCTTSDPQGRDTVFSLIPASLPRLVLVGRLDLNSEGLLLLTNSPALATTLMDPHTGLPRTYRVRFHGELADGHIAQLKKGISINRIRYRPIEVVREPNARGSKNNWAQVTLYEGKNREIRKVFEHFGMPVSRLIRIGFGGIELGNLPKGKLVEVPHNQLKKLQAKFPAGSA